ncbi:GNAT family N-acetyltransferase [Nonomuraea rhodomycinica]|uniref:GNAT family N-acetyltransferase n=1 Tax=Nonomuraea rhodomycinica TaxID=1712872 RepID=A0A7Y6MC65_9ACTN|nr:GNAT family N-acetyltransferase [Nonomuraea rhodomycinica]
MAEGMVRGAEEGDMPAVRAVARRFGLLRGWPAARDFLDAERAFGRLVLAPTANGRARGFGGTLRRGEVTHLGDLFVLPEHQSSGVGRALLAELLGGGGPKVTFASSDPRAMGLYIRYGLRPWCPLLYLTGPASGLPAPPVREARPEDVVELDARAGGGARPGTLAWYAATPGVTPYTTGEGYAFARVSGGDVVIGPAGGTTPQDCAEAALGALAATVRSTGPLGSNGASGSNGPSESAGDFGSGCAAGSTRAMGSAGASGSSGASASTGLEGSIGPVRSSCAGSTWARGSVGTLGSSGASRSTGPLGSSSGDIAPRATIRSAGAVPSTAAIRSAGAVPSTAEVRESATGQAGGGEPAPLVARIAVPGVHPLVSPLVEAGWRIGDLDTFMADDGALSLIRPDRYIPHPDLG